MTSTKFESSSPEIIRRKGNNLIGEQSVYLQQHAHNPINWYPWGDEALSRARAEDKPIFLSIGYASCHWCHVMEEQVFTHDDVAEFMNENFISIKVDREERPDLDAVYMEAVQAITGGGGWPMSVFLTPDLRPFYGGTYFPHDHFLLLAGQIANAFKSKRENLESSAEELREILAHDPKISIGHELSPKMITDTAKAARLTYDSKWGGFAGQMKFPTPVRWQFLLDQYRKTGSTYLADMIGHTLDMIGSGGIHDHVGGGFHRYATDSTWLVPHFEKMLYDNAQLARLYTEASVVFSDSRYKEIARSTLDFMISEMSGEEGGFYASYDADSDGREGLFYLWSYDEIRQIAGEKDGPALAMILGVSKDGNFEGKNIITRRADDAEIAAEFNIDEHYVKSIYARYQPALYKYRENRTRPNLDKKIIVSWNGLAIASLARAYIAFGERRYLEAAEKATDYILRVHYRKDGSLYRSSYNGQQANDGVLDDYAFLANGLLELFQAIGNIKYLEHSLDLIEYVRANFKKHDAGYYLTSANTKLPLGRKVELFDSVEPSGIAMMLDALIKAGAITGRTDYYDEIKLTLDAYSEVVPKAGLEMAGWLDVALKYNGPFYEVVIIGEGESSKDLRKVFREVLPSHAVLIALEGKRAGEEATELMPSLKDKVVIDNKPTAYVCKFGACKLPTTDPEKLRSQLVEGWTK